MIRPWGDFDRASASRVVANQRDAANSAPGQNFHGLIHIPISFGAYPYTGVVMDSSGNLYGDAILGGNLSRSPLGACGVVFRIDTSGSFMVLHTFTAGSNHGQQPDGKLLLDSAGNLYRTTPVGGDQSCTNSFGDSGCGAVFKLDASGNEAILHAFAGGATDGAKPVDAALVSDGQDNL
jgi:uncharacterized repeat protein (TIGR03803 family)